MKRNPCKDYLNMGILQLVLELWPDLVDLESWFDVWCSMITDLISEWSVQDKVREHALLQTLGG
jgi:hypothetical protein